ncbi:MAG: DUF2786 domain-containing protein [Nakamurella sp.]
MDDRNLARIAALLRKAEGTDNEHEADAYLQAAQRLATLASVDLAVARAHTAQRERRVVPTQRTIEIGDAGKRGLRTYVLLFLVIGRANDLICDVARNSTRVFAYGFAADIDAAEALYASLVVQMVRASDQFIKSGAHTEESVMREVRITEPSALRRGWTRTRVVHESRPVHATTARINFQEAFAARVGERLHEARTAARAEAVAADTGPRSTGVVLALRDRELELTDHYHSTSKARGSWSGSRATAGYSEASRRAGDRAGRSARLGGAQAIGGPRRSLDS